MFIVLKDFVKRKVIYLKQSAHQRCISSVGAASRKKIVTEEWLLYVCKIMYLLCFILIQKGFVTYAKFENISLV